jgi:predicted patatin/cPLA2 family phospholipase
MLKKALIISGGGAKGAFGCGLSQALKEIKDYDLYVGTSTGSLQMPLVALNKFPKLKEAYLAIKQKTIFNFNPFNKKGDINFLKLIYRLILNKDSLGESENLRKRIKEFFSEEDYNNILKQNKEIVSTVVSLTTKKISYMNIKDYSYNDMVDWIWASANSPIFMSFLNKNGERWTDGGVKEHVPIQYAIDNGYDEIDVIVHRPMNYEENKWYGKGIFKNLFRIIQILSENVSEDDISFSKLKVEDKDIILNIYYTPYQLTDKPLHFDKDEMKKWWEIGYKTGKYNTCCRRIIISK